MSEHDDVVRRLQGAAAPEPPPDLRAKLVAEAPAAVILPRAAPRRIVPRAALALAATLLLAVIVARQPDRPIPSAPAPPPVDPSGPASVQTPVEEVAPPPDSGASLSREAEVLAMAHGEEGRPADYDPRGRRDPYESVWDKKRRDTDRPAGVRGMEISELDLQGIVLSPDGKEKFAIVMGTDNKGYNLREGDELYNGKVKAIEKDRVTFLQKVSDPLSIKEYTEVVKLLAPEQR